MESLVEAIWNPFLLLGFVAVGVYITVLSGFFQTKVLFWWKTTLGQKEKGSFSQISALFTALATTIGTGSIAGVATAIWFGGPGAVFWMWVSAFFGMMLSACEKILTIYYREKQQDHSYRGGPMYYMEKGLGWVWAARFYGLACIFSTFIGGNLLQSSSIAQGMAHLFSFPKLGVGLVLMLVIFWVLQGGMPYVTRLSTLLVPAMASLYLGSGIYCLAQDIPSVCQAVKDILLCAFSPKAAMGGGYGMLVAMRFGMARGIFSNEAGLGASAIAHSNAVVDHPARQGMWGILEVFFATMIVCTLTALVILSSGIYDMEEAMALLATGKSPLIPVGVPMTQSAFSVHLGQWGSGIVLFSLVLFAFTSILGWSCYGAQAVEYLCPKAKKLYYLLTMLCIFWGSVGETTALWQWVDFSIAFMAVPNLIALVFLAPQAVDLLWQWERKESQLP